MKNLKDIIIEKLKISSDNTTMLDISNPEVVVDYLYSDDMTKRQNAIDCIREEIINSNCKQLKTTYTVKSSDLNFIQLSKIRVIDNSPNCITVCRRHNTSYVVIYIIADDSVYNKQPKRYIEGWSTTQPNLSPKTQELYEIPEDSILNEICALIREKYR